MHKQMCAGLYNFSGGNMNAFSFACIAVIRKSKGARTAHSFLLKLQLGSGGIPLARKYK